jgi:hypothetical protein
MEEDDDNAKGHNGVEKINHDNVKKTFHDDIDQSFFHHYQNE